MSGGDGQETSPGFVNLIELESNSLLRYHKEGRERGLSWREVMEEEEMELVEGPLTRGAETHIKIISSRPVWKELFSGQRKSSLKTYCDVHLITPEGFIPVHRIFLKGLSPFLDSLLNDADWIILKHEVATISLPDIKLAHLKAFLTLLYMGTVTLSEDVKEEDIRGVMELLQIIPIWIECVPSTYEDGRKMESKLVRHLRYEDEVTKGYRGTAVPVTPQQGPSTTVDAPKSSPIAVVDLIDLDPPSPKIGNEPKPPETLEIVIDSDEDSDKDDGNNDDEASPPSINSVVNQQEPGIPIGILTHAQNAFVSLERMDNSEIEKLMGASRQSAAADQLPDAPEDMAYEALPPNYVPATPGCPGKRKANSEPDDDEGENENISSKRLRAHSLPTGMNLSTSPAPNSQLPPTDESWPSSPRVIGHIMEVKHENKSAVRADILPLQDRSNQITDSVPSQTNPQVATLSRNSTISQKVDVNNFVDWINIPPTPLVSQIVADDKRIKDEINENLKYVLENERNWDLLPSFYPQTTELDETATAESAQPMSNSSSCIDPTDNRHSYRPPSAIFAPSSPETDEDDPHHTPSDYEQNPSASTATLATDTCDPSVQDTEPISPTDSSDPSVQGTEPISPTDLDFDDTLMPTVVIVTQTNQNPLLPPPANSVSGQVQNVQNQERRKRRPRRGRKKRLTKTQALAAAAAKEYASVPATQPSPNITPSVPPMAPPPPHIGPINIAVTLPVTSNQFTPVTSFQSHGLQPQPQPPTQPPPPHAELLNNIPVTLPVTSNQFAPVTSTFQNPGLQQQHQQTQPPPHIGTVSLPVTHPVTTNHYSPVTSSFQNPPQGLHQQHPPTQPPFPPVSGPPIGNDYQMSQLPQQPPRLLPPSQWSSNHNNYPNRPIPPLMGPPSQPYLSRYRPQHFQRNPLHREGPPQGFHPSHPSQYPPGPQHPQQGPPMYHLPFSGGPSNHPQHNLLPFASQQSNPNFQPPQNNFPPPYNNFQPQQNLPNLHPPQNPPFYPPQQNRPILPPPNQNPPLPPLPPPQQNPPVPPPPQQNPPTPNQPPQQLPQQSFSSHFSQQNPPTSHPQQQNQDTIKFPVYR